MFSFLRRKSPPSPSPLFTDVHAHFLPALDDGAKNLEEAKELVECLANMGYTKLIATPHIMPPRYPNNQDTILQKLTLLKKHIDNERISIEAAAEYFLDDSMLERMHASEAFMTFGDNYLLFELNHWTESIFLDDFLPLAIKKGYKPVLAHPERYQYLIKRVEKLEEIRNLGVLFQINILSILGVYSSEIKKNSIKLINEGWVDFLGSDCHNLHHIEVLRTAYKNNHVKRALELPLLNRIL